MNFIPSFDPTMLNEWSLVTAPFFAWIVAFFVTCLALTIFRRQSPTDVRNDMTDSPFWRWSFLGAVVWMFGGAVLLTFMQA
jgi:amino acid transporter